MSVTQNTPYDPLVAELQEAAQSAISSMRIANSIRYIVDETDGCIYMEKESEV